jgi:hypothetical protein
MAERIEVPASAHRSRVLVECEDSDETAVGTMDLTPSSSIRAPDPRRTQALTAIKTDLVRRLGESGWKHPAAGSAYLRHAYRTQSNGQTFWLTVSQTSRAVGLTINDGDVPW